MEFWLILAAALAPVLVLFIYICRCDKSQPEPMRWLLKGFLFGIFSTILSLCFSQPAEMLGLFTQEPTMPIESIKLAFLGAAVPEETAKLIMLWLLLRRNPYFDERIDGIVYAATIGLGFAAAENVLYLFSNYESWVSVGISRAIFAVPGHFFFAVAMGYFYSLAYFGKASTFTKFCVWFVPVLLHGTYDGILMVSETSPQIQGLLVLVFIVFCHCLRKRASKRIDAHIKADAESADRYWNLFNNRYR